MAEDLMHPETLSIEAVRAAFDAAMYDVALDGELRMRVSSGYLFWVTLAESRRFLRFTAVFRFTDGSDLPARLELANRINDDLVMIRAAASGEQHERLWLDYYVWLDGGMPRKNVVLAFRQFEALVEAALKKDTGGLIR
jgi:hypothetical protein